jgi:undecaprenyl-diphosphatase
VLTDQIWQALVLGVLQGLTEFLPISSSAHLILLPWIMDWTPLGLVFDVMVHGGTLMAILIYFRKEWKEFIQDVLSRIREFRLFGRRDTPVDAVVVGTAPAVLVALAFRHAIEEYARTPLVTVMTLAVFGGLLLFADRRSRGGRTASSMGLRDGLLVGAAQALALIPGVSRSGVTITAALLVGCTRAEAARFSFLLAGPVLVLGTLDGLLTLLTGGPGEAVPFWPLLVGVVVSFLVGFLCIKYFIRFLQSHTFLPFVVYRLLLASAILAIHLAGG